MNDKIAIELCNAVMPFGDDHGDNSCTFRCMLNKDHEGKHREWGNLYGKYPYSLEWEGDYRDEETFVWCWHNTDAWLSEFEEIAEKHNLVYEIERDDPGVDVILNGHAKEIYEKELYERYQAEEKVDGN